ncbi:MAG: phosphotransferase [Propionibacteriaceae bacterium]|nr:phosphotransferase [Propionibacteriaceae bacterium]
MAVPNVHLWRDYLVHARWFQGKGLAIGAIGWHPLAWYTNDGDVWVRSELAITQVGENTETYHLLVGYLPVGQAEPSALIGQIELPDRGLVDVVDAPHSPRAMAALLQAITAPGAPGVTWFAPPPNPFDQTDVFSGEQSNTTVRIGDATLFKIFRKLSLGPNLESQVLAALAHCGITPQLIGTLRASDDSYELGIFSQRIAHAQDGWAWCVTACRAGRPINDEMADLGATLRRLHADLADVFGTTTIDASQIGQQMLARLDAARAQVPELDTWAAPLRAVLGLPAASVQVQRVHGDFHLGQVLMSPTGWTIIDFEGEPLKTPAERAAPDTVWRDVAGLLRSLDYARCNHDDPDGDQARQWYQGARQAFLDGYLGASPLPQPMLTAYEVDKAIYELVYETRNRPTWASLPRQAIAEAINWSA